MFKIPHLLLPFLQESGMYPFGRLPILLRQVLYSDRRLAAGEIS